MLAMEINLNSIALILSNWNLSGRGPSICSRRPFGHLKAPLGFHCFANANFTYLDNGNVNFPDNKKYSRSKPTIIRIPPTTLMPIRLTLLFFIILFAKTNSSAPTTIIKTDINGYMSFLLSNSDLSSSVYHTESHCKRAYVRRPQAAKVSPGEIPVRQTPHRSAVSVFR